MKDHDMTEQRKDGVREDAPRVVDHAEAGYSEWLREDVPLHISQPRTYSGIDILLADKDNRFVGVRWPLAPQSRDGEKA